MVIMNLLHKLFDKKRPLLAMGAVEVGWIITAEKSSMIWEEPRALEREGKKPNSAKSVQVCPAVLDFDARHFVVPCPITTQLRFEFDAQGRPTLKNLAGDQSAIRTKHLNQVIVLTDRKEWRHPDRPIIQIVTPYIFLADEPVFINQIPPFLEYNSGI